MPETIVQKPSLRDPGVHQAVVERIGRLTKNSRPAWGEMTVGQMLAHCAEVQDVLNGAPLVGTPWWIKAASPLIKRVVLGGRPFPRGIGTHPQYRQAEERSFDAERRRLLASLADFRASEDGLDHPLFGHLTPDEAGWSAYKHLDHHLRQFGV